MRLGHQRIPMHACEKHSNEHDKHQRGSQGPQLCSICAWTQPPNNDRACNRKAGACEKTEYRHGGSQRAHRRLSARSIPRTRPPMPVTASLRMLFTAHCLVWLLAASPADAAAPCPSLVRSWEHLCADGVLSAHGSFHFKRRRSGNPGASESNLTATQEWSLLWRTRPPAEGHFTIGSAIRGPVVVSSKQICKIFRTGFCSPCT